MRIYMISGEASGDLHGSNLIKSLKNLHPNAQFRGFGGDLMRAAGLDLQRHISDLAYMGFWEVLRHLPKILRNLSFCKKDILSFSPDVLVLIDYPGFNLRLAKWAKKQGIRVVYYIAPQAWAWNKKRVKVLAGTCDSLLCILPFEEEFFKENGVSQAIYVGNPLCDLIQKPTRASTIDQNFNRKVIALLPGSRRQEIKRTLPVMLDMMRQFPEFQFVVAGAPSISADFYQEFLNGRKRVSLVHGKTYEVLRLADGAIVTSGTATLETALHGVPQVVVYRGNWFSYLIAKRLVKTKYISLPNLILDEPILEEKIQGECHPDEVGPALSRAISLLNIEKIRLDYDNLRLKLGGNKAADRVAKIISESLISKK